MHGHTHVRRRPCAFEENEALCPCERICVPNTRGFQRLLANTPTNLPNSKSQSITKFLHNKSRSIKYKYIKSTKQRTRFFLLQWGLEKISLGCVHAIEHGDSCTSSDPCTSMPQSARGDTPPRGRAGQKFCKLAIQPQNSMSRIIKHGIKQEINHPGTCEITECTEIKSDLACESAIFFPKFSEHTDQLTKFKSQSITKFLHNKSRSIKYIHI